MSIPNDELNQYPAHPGHSNFISPNPFYPDGSMFAFDQDPRYVLSDWFDRQRGGVYEMPGRQSFYDFADAAQPKFQMSYQGWTNWADKFQKDYRFSSQSDSNARATLFPEVNDPWMYTEYVYEGTKTKNDLRPVDADGLPQTVAPVVTGIVTPPLVAPHTVARTLNSDQTINTSNLVTLNDQPETVMRQESQTVYNLENKWKSAKAPFKEYWQSELEAMGWGEQLADGSINLEFDRLSIQRRTVKYALPVLNSGVRLYRHPVWAQNTRWGESGNIPARTVDLTGPREFFKPNAIFTGRIVPHIKIEWGIPIYDEVAHPDQGEQTVIRYSNPGATAGERIFLWPTTPTGPVGKADGQFTYAVPPNNWDFSGAYEIQNMPRKNVVARLNWNELNYADDDLVHEGCTFWKGNRGTAFCDYFRQNQTNLTFPGYDSTQTFTDPSAVLGDISVAPFFEADDQCVVYVADNTHAFKPVTSLGKTLTLIHGAENAVVAVRVGPGTIIPGSSSTTTGFFASPSGPVLIRVVVQSSKMPYPDPPKCAMYKGPTASDKTIDPKNEYIKAGGKCQYYTPGGKRVVHSYTAVAANGAEWANMQRGLPPGYKKGPLETAFGQTMASISQGSLGFGAGIVGGIAGLSLAAALVPDPFTAGVPKEDNSRITVEYIPETIGVGGKSTYYNTPNRQPRSGPNSLNDVRIDPTTGFYTFDDEDVTPFGGVDSTFYGMINQINYRVMHNVQHCFKADKCTPIIHTPNGNVGWRRGCYSNVDFTKHALRMPGFPAIDGSDSYCHVGDGRCPYNRLDRRAHEYNENYKILVREILSPFRILGVGGFSGFGIQEGLILADGTLSLSPDLVQNATGMLVGVRLEDTSPPVIGHYAPLVKDANGTQYRVFFYYDRPSTDPLHKQSHVMAHIVQFNDESQAQFMTPPDNATAVIWQKLYVTPAALPWLVELADNYQEPSGNLIYTTNSKPFAGGRAPEYKDRSLLGQQILCTQGGYEDNSFMTGATLTNQFGGPSFNTAPISGQVKMGYWIQKYGEWILDGRPIGYGEGFVPPKPRMKNHPSIMGTRVPVDGSPSITIQDPEKPDSGQQSDYAAVGWTYSNDTKALLKAFRDGWWDAELPIDPFTGEKVHIIPPSPNEDFLPRERFWYQCDKCGMDYSEEEVTLFSQMTADSHGTKLYPLPSGVTGSARPIPPSGAAMGCLRGDGGAVYNKGSYVRFLKTYGRGEVDVWAPPGTTVMHDGYFWKAPTFVSRAHKDQLVKKLGEWNKSGGGVQFKGLTGQVEVMGRLPVTTSRSYQVGLSRQIVAPWAAPGQTVAAVRNTWGKKFNLLPGDVAFVQRGQAAPQAITNESFPLQLFDLLMFFRTEYDGSHSRIGIPISVCATAPSTILTDPSVTSDEPLPVRTDYANDAQGERLYQSALNRWLVSCVAGTIQNFSSSPWGHANLWAEILQSEGLDPNNAKPYNPATNTSEELDERIIAPYTARADGGLKMITLREMKFLRNRVLPMLAYSMTAKTYTAGGDFTDRAQAGHTNRFQETRKPMPFQKYGTIDPQVLCANTTGKEAYAEWDKGDIITTKARAYYPTGPTWWRINQTVGCIKRQGGTNYMHLDKTDDSPNPEGPYPFAFPYTGDDVISGVVFFIHGRIPMHMEVLRAFLIYTPNDAPEMEAIGCQGQYTGFVSPPSLYDSGYQAQSGDYKGHSMCWWMHYHGYTTNHELDHPLPYYGREARNHVLIGHNKPSYFKDRGTMNDPSTPWLLSSSDVVQLQETTGEMQYEPFMAGDSKARYFDQVDIMGINYEDVAHGFDVPPQPWFGAWSFGQDLVLTETEHAIWKDIDYSHYGTLWDRYHVNGQAQVDGIEKVQSFEYVASYFRNYLWPREQSAIPGWIDMSGYDSSGLFSKYIGIETKTVDSNWANGPQVILQAGGTDAGAGGSAAGGHQTGGGNGTQQAGSAEKVMDVTDIIKKIYNDRVARYFRVLLGASYDSLYALIKGKTDTNEGRVDRFHQDYSDPWYFWNYRYLFRVGGTNYGMWLTDPWHHPPLQNDNVVGDDDQGDPINQTTFDRDARVLEVSDWDKQSKPDTDADYKQYHPISLCQADQTLTPAMPPYAKGFNFNTPRPSQSSTRYWRALDDQVFTHYFTMDLRQTPYETDRRNWREKPPTIDSSNATCPNTSCFIHDKGWTMGQLLENSTGSWGGYGVVPSLTSPYCPNCRTKLVGVVYLDGDGVLTAHYDLPTLPDALVTTVEASSEVAPFTSHHGFIVDYFNSITQNWRPLFFVNYDTTLHRFEWMEWYNHTWNLKTGSTPPTLFKGCEGSGDLPKNTNVTGVHFIAVTASKLRYRVPKPAATIHTLPVGGGTLTCAQVGTTQKITTAADLTEDARRFVGREITLTRTLTGPPPTTEDRTLKITAADNNGGVTDGSQGGVFTLSGPITSDFVGFKMQWVEYESRCTKFRAYGYPFSKDDLIITPPGYVTPLIVSPGVTSFRLNNWPTQIYSVSATVGDSEPVVTEESSTMDPSTFYWTVEKDTTAGLTPVDYLRITKCVWFYDYTSNTINIPAVYKDPDNVNPATGNHLWPIFGLNETLYKDPLVVFPYKTLPNLLNVEFYTGNGMPIDVKVESCGKGPSYQLEAECVQFIAQPGDSGIPTGFSSDALPAMGQSVPMKTNAGSRVALNWQVYNHKPLIWDNEGNKNIGWIVGDEMPPRGWGRDDLFNVLTGGLGDNLAQLGQLNSDGTEKGQGSRIGGKVTGTCTLYGSPNTILSGNLVVYAKAITSKTYQTPDGPVTMTERTGGYRCGGFTFGLRITDSVQGKRTGLTCGVPTVLVWARERNLDHDDVPLA